MTSELIITSVPNGLFPGTYGFCAVACTKNMNERMRQALNSVSGYRRLSDDQSKNPIAFSHYIYNIGGKNYNVLSRIADAGVDYTRRTNKLAQFHVFENGEGERLGDPATMCFDNRTFRKWNVEDKPDFLDPYRFPTYRRLNGSEAVHGAWKRLTGDAGWAGVLAGTTATRRPVALIVPQGFDVTPLILEAVAVLPEELRWKATFSTYFTSVPPNVQCQWKTLIDGAYDAKLLNNPNTLKLDLRAPAKLGSVDAVKDDSAAEYIAIARGERKREQRPQAAKRDGGPMLGGKRGNLEDIQDEIDILNCLNEDLPKKGRSSRSPIPTKEVRETLNSDDYTIPELVDVPEDKPAEVYRPPEKNRTALWIGLGVGFGLALACIIGFTAAIILKLSNKDEAPEAAPDAPAATAEAQPAEKQDAPKEEEQPAPEDAPQPAPVEEKTEPEPETKEEAPQPAEPEEPKEEQQQPATPAEAENESPVEEEKTEPAEPAESEEAVANADNAEGEEKEAEPEPKTVEVNVDEMIDGLFTVDPNNISTIVNNLVLYAGFADALKKTLDSAAEIDKKKDKTAADHLALYRAAKSLSEDYKGVESAEKLAPQAVERAKACAQNLRKYFDALSREDNEKARNSRQKFLSNFDNVVDDVEEKYNKTKYSKHNALFGILPTTGDEIGPTDVDNKLDRVDKFLNSLSVEEIKGAVDYLKPKNLAELQKSSVLNIYKIFCKGIDAGDASRFEVQTSNGTYPDGCKVIKGKDDVAGGKEFAELVFKEKKQDKCWIKLTLVNDSKIKFREEPKDVPEEAAKEPDETPKEVKEFVRKSLEVDGSHYHAAFEFEVVGSNDVVTFYVGLNEKGKVRLAINDVKYIGAVLSAVKFEWSIVAGTTDTAKSKKQQFLKSSSTMTDFSFDKKIPPKFIEKEVVSSEAKDPQAEVYCVVDVKTTADLASQNADFTWNLEEPLSGNIRLVLLFNYHEQLSESVSFGYSGTTSTKLYNNDNRFEKSLYWDEWKQMASCGDSKNNAYNFDKMKELYNNSYRSAHPGVSKPEIEAQRIGCQARILKALGEWSTGLSAKFYLVHSKNLTNEKNWIELGEIVSTKAIAEADLMQSDVQPQ